MIIYDWRVAKKSSLADRFVDGLNPDWRSGICGEAWWREWIDSLVDAEDAEQRLLRFAGPPPGPPPEKPIVFVSHRQADRSLAKETALLAVECGFDVWVDVLDPTLTALEQVPVEKREPLLMPRIIEMGLVNATHVLVVRTPHTDGSTWVPYQYGRAKDSDAVGNRAACWVAIETDAELPAYYHLGHVAKSKKALTAWLDWEADDWGVSPPAAPSNRTTSRPAAERGWMSLPDQKKSSSTRAREAPESAPSPPRRE